MGILFLGPCSTNIFLHWQQLNYRKNRPKWCLPALLYNQDKMKWYNNAFNFNPHYKQQKQLHYPGAFHGTVLISDHNTVFSFAFGQVSQLLSHWPLLNCSYCRSFPGYNFHSLPPAYSNATQLFQQCSLLCPDKLDVVIYWHDLCLLSPLKEKSTARNCVLQSSLLETCCWQNPGYPRSTLWDMHWFWPLHKW